QGSQGRRPLGPGDAQGGPEAPRHQDGERQRRRGGVRAPGRGPQARTAQGLRRLLRRPRLRGSGQAREGRLMGAGSAKAHQSYTVAPATTSSGSVSQVPAASVADLESLAAEPGHDSAAAVLLVDPVDAASAVVADPLPAPATPEDAAPPGAAAGDPWDEAVTPVPPTAPAGEVLGVP